MCRGLQLQDFLGIIKVYFGLIFDSEHDQLPVVRSVLYGFSINHMHHMTSQLGIHNSEETIYQ